MAQDFRQALGLLSTTSDLPSLRSLLTTLGSAPPALLLQELQASDPKRLSLSSALSNLIFRNELELEGLCTVLNGTEVLPDCIPAVLWVLLAGTTKRYVEPLAVALYQGVSDKQSHLSRQLKVPLVAEDRLLVIRSLLQVFTDSSDQRAPASITMLLELMSNLQPGLGEKPGASPSCHPELSEEVLNLAVLSSVRIAKNREDRARVLGSLEAYAVRRLFASTILAIRAIRSLETTVA